MDPVKEVSLTPNKLIIETRNVFVLVKDLDLLMRYIRKRGKCLVHQNCLKMLPCLLSRRKEEAASADTPTFKHFNTHPQ